MNRSSTGLADNVAAALCYVLGWLSGLILLLVEQRSAYVRFHAMQSVMVFGGLAVIGLVLPILGVSAALGPFLGLLSFVLWILLITYHDHEWGVPSRDDAHLFEMLLLDNAQAGLAWVTILRKREGYRRAFCGFDPQRIARFDEADQARLLQDAGIVRNRLKVASAVRNARAWLRVREEFGSFADYLWAFVDGEPVQNTWRTLADVPATSPLSDRVSKDLQGRGFNFVGSTIIYAYLQSVGVVNDHTVDCFRHAEVRRLRP